MTGRKEEKKTPDDYYKVRTSTGLSHSTNDEGSPFTLLPCTSTGTSYPSPTLMSPGELVLLLHKSPLVTSY